MGKENKGITLLALVITVIILLILAGITLSLTLGENGIINKAKQAKNDMELAQIQEQEELNRLYIEMENSINSNDSSNIPSVADTNFKKQIAEAITDMGVATDETASAETMAENIRNIINKDEYEELKNTVQTLKESAIVMTQEELDAYVEQKLDEEYLYYTFSITKSGAGTTKYMYSDYFTIPNSSQYEYKFATWRIIGGSGYAENWVITPDYNYLYIWARGEANGTLEITVCYRKK